jgi:hypothetical protein
MALSLDSFDASLVEEVRDMEEFKIPTVVNQLVIDHANIILALEDNKKGVMEEFLSSIQNKVSIQTVLCSIMHIIHR